MKKYKVLKDLPGIKAGGIIKGSAVGEKYYDVGEFVFKEEMLERNKDFFEEIIEKKTFDTLTPEDKVFFIDYNGEIYCGDKFTPECCRSETFVSKEAAEDEHKRREWANRKDKFIPKEGEYYYFYRSGREPDITWNIYKNNGFAYEGLLINNGLCFRTEEECQYAIDNHDIVRLFYTIK